MVMDVDVFQTLADPTRRSIVEALRGRGKAVGEIVGSVSIRQSGVSRHLRILQEAGFVEVRAVGTKRVYSLLPERFKELERWVSGYRSLWEARLDRFEAALDDDQPAQDSKTSGITRRPK
jgi:DNA-binding transcriptional ArsR family regulator